MKKNINVFRAIFSVGTGKRTNTRDQRFLCSAIVFGIAALILGISIVMGGFMWSSAAYFGLSAIKHLGKAIEGISTANNWAAVLLYNFATPLKQKLIDSSDIAAFYNACNIGAFGKVVEFSFMTIGTALFTLIAIIARKAIGVMAQSILEIYLITHRTSDLYDLVLRNFVSDYKSKKFSSRDMQKDTEYDIFWNEPEVQKLFEAKLRRENMTATTYRQAM